MMVFDNNEKCTISDTGTSPILASHVCQAGHCVDRFVSIEGVCVAERRSESPTPAPMDLFC